MSRYEPAPYGGETFDDEDVARAYRHRPPYPEALHDRLAQIAPRRGRALDLGCGPGKLARGLAERFGAVVAIDPARPMIALAKALDGGAHPNIDWICAKAEDADLGAPFDLAVGGASLHWMDHERMFPRLCDAAGSDARIAAVEGDGPSAAAWLDDYRALIRGWVERFGFEFNGPAFRARASAHEAWMTSRGARRSRRRGAWRWPTSSRASIPAPLGRAPRWAPRPQRRSTRTCGGCWSRTRRMASSRSR